MRTILKTAAASPVPCSFIHPIQVYQTPLQGQPEQRWTEPVVQTRTTDLAQLALHPNPTVATPFPAQVNGPSCNQNNRCLAHCWMDDSQREQGQRCLVGCWQTNHHAYHPGCPSQAHQPQTCRSQR